jgi:NTE family protein
MEIIERYNAVFEGGGIRGIGILGALKFFHKCNISWKNLAGTSVGAIIASLLAAGYTPQEMQDILFNINYQNFLDNENLHRVPLIGKHLSILKEKGMYSGEYFENWIKNLLKEKRIVTFKDVSCNGNSRLKIMATDITLKRKLVLPDDLINYGLDPMRFEIGKAIRMSISIPFYFKPVKFEYGNQVSYIVDGAVCCNYPLRIFDDKTNYSHPTLGFKFLNSNLSLTSQGKTDAMSFLIDITSTMATVSQDQILTKKDEERTIFIPTNGVESTDFAISKKQSVQLFKAGYRAAALYWNNSIKNDITA